MDQSKKNMRGKDCLVFGIVLLALFFSASCQQQISYPAPTVTSLSPNNMNAGSPAFTLTVIGSHLTPASYVTWNGSRRVSFFQDENHVTADILQSDIEDPGLAQVTVTTPSPGGGTFQPALDFTINPVSVPVPSISSISPTGVYANGPALTLRIFGNNFVATSIVTVNGANRTTAEVNSTELGASLTAADVVNAGAVQIAVINPPVPNPPAGVAPGGGSSNIVSLNVTNPVPVLSGVTPTAALIGAANSVKLTVAGSGFVSTSTVLVNGSARTTGFSDTASLSVTLNAGDLTLSGVDSIQVANPTPGGGTSNKIPFAVNPTIGLGLPTLLDYAYDGSVSNSGVCGTNCTNVAAIPNLSTAGPSLSEDGKTVAFASISSNLLLNQTNSASEIFTRTTCLSTGSCVPTTSVLSVGANNAVANGPAEEPSMDSTAAHVAFTSTATDLTNYTNPPAGVRQIYWEAPLCTGTGTTVCAGAVIVSLGADGNPGNGDSYNPAISPDGDFVAFVSLATNLVSGVSVDGATPQVYIRTMCDGVTPVTQTSSTCTPTTYLVSSADGVTPGNGASSHPSVSSDGDYVAFASTSSNWPFSPPSTPNQSQAFVQEMCQIITTGCTTPFLSIASTPDGTTLGDKPSIEPVISEEGRFIAFASAADNLGATTNGVQQVFVRDTCTSVSTTITCLPRTYLVSTQDGSTASNGLSESPSMSEGCGSVTSTTTTCSTTAGPFIAYATLGSNLGPNVTPGVENIFVRNTCLAVAAGNACSSGSVLVSLPGGALPEPSNGSSASPSISADGHTVAFLSASTNLVSASTGGFEHVYLGATGF